MEWFANVLRDHVELALFLSLAAGHGLGLLRFGTFQVGPVLGTLVVGVIVGQIGIRVPGALQAAFFLLFVFAVGFRAGPEFLRSLRASVAPQLALTVLLCTTALALAWSFARLFGLDAGTAAGLFAGALTNSPALGSATNATAGVGLDGAGSAALARNVATAYALTYVPGALLVVWFVPTIGPRLLGVNLPEAAREVERPGEAGSADGSAVPARGEITARAYRLPSALAGRTVAEIERLWPADQRVIIARVRRGGVLVDATANLLLESGDCVAVTGRSAALVAEANPLRDEITDPDLVSAPAVSGEIVLTNRRWAGRTMRDLTSELGARSIFLLALRRAGRPLPLSWSTIVERGDVMTVTGTRPEVARVAAELGFAEYPTEATDLLLVSGTIVIGGLVGLATLTIGKFVVSVTAPVGVLLAGLILGHLRSINPRFGRIPEAAVSLFQSLGLAAFLALTAIQSGPGMVSALQANGAPLLLAGVMVTLVPHAITILIGKHFTRLNACVLLGVCAGAGTSAATLAALEKGAESRLPTLGYGIACAVGNVLMAMGGTLLVLASR
jgi:putative transport protein